MFHVKHEGWDLPGDIDIELGAAVRARLERYEEQLLGRAVPMGMVAASDAPRLRERHIVDSLRGVPHLPDQGTVCDLGSGAGLPGLVLAITRPDLRFVLVEVRRNRARFLERAAEDLENVTVHPRRLETYRQQVEMCTARAYASPSQSWEAAARLLGPGGRLLYWAGSSYDPATDLPEGVSGSHFTTSALARSGPLVIMARQ
jgi:16S rRNA (guanine(527)-N(7))-methyltransferase RsmG